VHVQKLVDGSGKHVHCGISLSCGHSQVTGSAGHCDSVMVDVIVAGRKNCVLNAVEDGVIVETRGESRAARTGTFSGSGASRIRSGGEYRVFEPFGRLLLTYSRIAISATVAMRAETNP
jgi:hypothetical protein